MSTYTKTINGITFTRNDDIMILDGTATANTTFQTGVVLNSYGVVDVASEEIILPGPATASITHSFEYISGSKTVEPMGSTTLPECLYFIPLNSNTESIGLEVYAGDTDTPDPVTIQTDSNVRSIKIVAKVKVGSVFDNYTFKLCITSDYETSNADKIDLGLMQPLLSYLGDPLTDTHLYVASNIYSNLYLRPNNLITLHRIKFGTGAFLKLSNGAIMSKTSGEMAEAQKIFSSGDNLKIQFKPYDSTWTLSSSGQFQISLRDLGTSSATTAVATLDIGTTTPDEDGWYTTDAVLTEDVGSVCMYGVGFTCSLLTFALRITKNA